MICPKCSTGTILTPEFHTLCCGFSVLPSDIDAWVVPTMKHSKHILTCTKCEGEFVAPTRRQVPVCPTCQELARLKGIKLYSAKLSMKRREARV